MIEYSDAFDEKGNLLDTVIIRGKERPEGIYFKAVQIYTFDEKGKLLVTLRHPDKVFGLKWEVTAGALQKGETETQGAVRELKEETGIEVDSNQLIHFSSQTERYCLWSVFMVRIQENEPKIQLQEGETIDYKWITLMEFEAMMRDGMFPQPMETRYANALESFQKTLIHDLGFML